MNESSEKNPIVYLASLIFVLVVYPAWGIFRLFTLVLMALVPITIFIGIPALIIMAILH